VQLAIIPTTMEGHNSLVCFGHVAGTCRFARRCRALYYSLWLFERMIHCNVRSRLF